MYWVSLIEVVMNTLTGSQTYFPAPYFTLVLWHSVHSDNCQPWMEKEHKDTRPSGYQPDKPKLFTGYIFSEKILVITTAECCVCVENRQGKVAEDPKEDTHTM